MSWWISTVLILHAGINRRVECGSTVGPTTLESPKGELPKGSPTNIILSFDDPSTVTVYFKQPKEESIEIRECKVYICKEAAIGNQCQTKKTKNTEAKFTKLEAGATYYATATCSSQSGPGPLSPWIIFVTPIQVRRTVPGKIAVQGSGIEVHLTPDDGINMELVWSFSFTNKSSFPIENVEKVIVHSYKRHEDGVYIAKKEAEATRNGKVRVGLSPSFSFDTGCHFYSANVTFVDGTNAFVITDEKCYGFFSASFIILYVIVGTLVIVAIVGIAMSSMISSKYAPEPSKRSAPKKKPVPPPPKKK